MAQTIDNVTVPPKTWVDLYATTSITVGNQIIVAGLGSNEVLLYSGATAPTDFAGYTVLTPYGTSTNDTGDPGAWAYSLLGSIVNVREA